MRNTIRNLFGVTNAVSSTGEHKREGSIGLDLEDGGQSLFDDDIPIFPSRQENYKNLSQDC
jgi:hypothetical protein